MTNFGNLPFEKLIAYQEARKLLEAMREAAISDGRLRDQALRPALDLTSGPPRWRIRAQRRATWATPGRHEAFQREEFQTTGIPRKKSAEGAGFFLPKCGRQ